MTDDLDNLEDTESSSTQGALPGRLAYSAALIAIAIAAVNTAGRISGALAYTRFGQYVTATRPDTPQAQLAPEAASMAFDETASILRAYHGDAQAMSEVGYHCLRWSSSDEISPLLRIRLAERAFEASLLATAAAPSDYLPWLWLSHSAAAMGLPQISDQALDRCNTLAPPGVRFEARVAPSP